MASYHDGAYPTLSSPHRLERGLRGNMLIAAVVGFCSLGFLLFGYDQGVMGGIVVNPLFLGLDSRLVDPDILGITVSVFLLGALVGSLIVSTISNKVGRRYMIIVASTMTVVFGALQSAAQNLAMFIAFRILLGVGVGILTSVCPVYLAEFCPPKHRGLITSIELILCAAGLILSFWVDYGVAEYTSSFSWRFPLALQIIFPLMMLPIAPFIPETPRFLVVSGDVQGASAVLHRIYANNPSEAKHTLQQITEAVEVENATAVKGYLAAFRSGPQRFRRRTLLAMGALFCQQSSGVNVVTYYGTTVFLTSLGLKPKQALLFNGWNGILALASTTISVLGGLVDSVGRVRLMIVGAAMMAISMAVLAGVTGPTHMGDTTLGAVGTAFIFIYFSFFSSCWLAPSWLYPSEIAPLAIRSQVASLASATNWIINFVVVQITPKAIASIQNRFFIVFAVFNALTVILLILFYPETSRLTLEEIGLLFESDKVIMRRSPRAKLSNTEILPGGTHSGMLDHDPISNSEKGSI